MRKFLIIIMFFIATIFTTPINAKELQFAQISDTHISLPYVDEPNDGVEKTATYLKKAIKEINKNKKIKFVVFTGDNINSAEKQDLKAFLRLANKLNKPYYIAIGNREVLQYKNFVKKDYMRTVGFHNHNMMFKKANYVFQPNRELVFIVVDGTNEFIPSTNGYFRPETLEWLDNQLYKYKNKKVVIVQHYPLIPPTKKNSYNTLEPEKYFHVLNSHENVIAIISGHFHQDNMIYKKGIYHLSAPSFATSPYQYKIIKINYEPKYLFADPTEFTITQQLIPMEKVQEIQEEATFEPSYTEENNEQ